MVGFAHNKGIERRYAAQLAKVAKEVGKLAARFADDVPGLVRALKEYAARLEPWAAQVADRFIGEVDKANARAWAEKSQTIAKALKGDVARSAIGLAAQERHFAQVTLITSLPLEAAARAQKLAEDAARGGKRAGDVREAILETESVTASRAQLIARTEIAKANAALTEARAQMAGITHYIWRTMQDEDVRESHAALEGQIFAFDAPPVVDEGGAYNPGGVYNCFLGDTPVYLDAGVRRILRAPYSGVIVDVHLGGVVFRATPNHPILTRSGWVAAGKLKRGDEVVARGLPAIGEHDVNNAPPSFDEVYFALAAAAETVAGVKFDFYGDLPAGDVQSIAVNDELLHRLKTGGLQGGEKLALAFANGGDVASNGVGGKVLHSLGARGGSNGAQVIGAGGSEADKVCLGAAADMPPMSAQQLDDWRASAAKGVGNFLHTHARLMRGKDEVSGQREAVMPAATRDSHAALAQLDAQNIGVAADSGGGVFEHSASAEQFLRVEQVVFGYSESCHVYTLETLQGWYRVTPAGIIAKNCRCFAEPILTQPDAPLELIAPGTTIEQRAAEVAAAITRSVAARKAAATRAAKKAETVASRAIAAREAKAVAQVEKGAEALRAAAAKAAARAEKATVRQAGTVSAYNKTKKAATVAAKTGETAMNTITREAKVGMNPKFQKTVAVQIPAVDYTNAAAVEQALAWAETQKGSSAVLYAVQKEAQEAANALLKARGLKTGETIGYGTGIKGLTQWDTVYPIYGNTYAHKEALKAAGAKWSGNLKAWVFTSRADMLAFAKS